MLALKALEQEAYNNAEKETIKLARICGANVDEAVRKYNQELEEKIRKRKKEIKEIQKEKL